METQKIVNLLNDADNESSKFATRKWYVINDQNNGEYGEGKENDSSIKFEVCRNVRIAVPLKYLSNFFRSLEMPLVNCKIHLELN